MPAALAAWAAAWWATAASVRSIVVATVGCALVGATLVATSLRNRDRSVGAGLGERGRRWTLLGMLGLASSLVVLASTGAQTASRLRPPLREWIRERAVVEAAGRVTSDAQAISAGPAAGRPRKGPGAAGRQGGGRFVVRMRLDRVTARGRTARADAPVLVLGGPEWSELTAGQRAVVTGRLSASEPGDDVVALTVAQGPPRAVIPGSPMWRVADRLRRGLRDACRGLPADAGGLLPSLVVGDTSRLPPPLRDDLRVAGLTHVTAVSGTNVAIVAGAVLWSVTRLGAARPLRPLSAGLVVAGFVVVARPQPSVLRAAAMGGVALLGLGLSRRAHGMPALAAAALCLLAVDPWLSRSPGFALSCVATGSLLLLAPAWTGRLSRRLPLPLAAALAVPAAAQAACGPLAVLLNPSVSLVAVPANVLVEPAVAPATVAGAVAAVIAPVSPAAAHGWAWLGSCATGWIAWVAHTAAAVPFAGMPWPSGLRGAVLLALVTAGLVIVTLLPRRPSRPVGPAAGRAPPGRHPSSTGVSRPGAVPGPRRRSGHGMLLAIALVLAAGGGWLLGTRTPLPGSGRAWPPPGWAVVQCDVGQGTATVLRSGTDRGVLVDAGPSPAAVESCLRRLRVHHLDLVLLTHFHADHVLGLPGALHRRDVGQVLVSPLAEPATQATAVRHASAGAGALVTEGWADAQGRAGRDGWIVRWRLMAPERAAPPRGAGSSEPEDGTVVNEASVAWAVEVSGPGGSLRAGGLGDLEADGQQRLLRYVTGGQAGGEVAAWLPLDVLVVAHHGSARQVPRLYRRLAPRVALVGVGEGNDHGHPARSTLAMLLDAGAVVERTDLDGHVALVPAGDGGLSVAVTGT